MGSQCYASGRTRHSRSLWANKTLENLTDADFDAFTVAVDAAPSASYDTRSHHHARAFSLHQACYELRICESAPRRNRPAAATLAEVLEALPQPEIRRVALRYLGVASVSKRTVVDLRAFFEDLAVWGWAERPTRSLVFASDVPRLDRPMPRALAPDADRDLMAAAANLADPFARYGIAILRGTGMRLGELLDLELDCLWDFASKGTRDVNIQVLGPE